MDNQQALELLHRYHDATNAGALDELDDIFADDFINFAAGFEPVKSLAAMKTLIRELLLAFPDWHVTVEDMFGQDNKVVTRWSLRATPCSLSRHPGDRAQDSRRRNSYRSYRRRQDRQTLGLQQLRRGLQQAQGSGREIARMSALVELGIDMPLSLMIRADEMIE